ncbi:CLUMA_CG019979, isoform A [Clunio marinus]|uniref:CLUMA_CG019979, isoform A n=1 Tax=Clunio marinus TaxID=568069 RepID=A0A1J1J3I2_9DIPT|nr:CLUMA_CG019979, isoform A [Clunio marinus]
MLVLLIVCFMKLIEMYTNNNKMARNKSARDAKENNFDFQNNMNKKLEMFDEIEEFGLQNDSGRCSMNYFYDIDQSCVDQLKEFLHKKPGINSYRGMTDYSTNQPATVKNKLIKTGTLTHQPNQQAGFRPKPSLLKQPLSSINTNYINNNNNNNYDRPQTFNRTRTLSSRQKNARINSNDFHLNLNDPLSDDALKSNVQIVLSNIQNALLNQQAKQDLTYQDRFQYLNIFGEQSPPSTDGAFIVNNQRNFHCQNLRRMSTSPADCDNTNNNNMGPASMLGCSFASDFTHDNSDYQWFVDYGYRDGVQHHSILSSLSASYNGIGELSYYDDLAKNLDANLAEVDMENFRSEDIHSLLHIQQDEQTNPTRKLILKDQAEFDNSICKSEILFSPVKESHISVDSLDMDGYADDIILTCQANKNNYTIAFEGSCMYSDDSYYDIPENGKLKHNIMNMDKMLNNKKTNDNDMTQSDTGFTTWSQLKKSSDFNHIQSSQSSIDSASKHKTMLPMYAIPITTSDSDSPAPNDNSTSNNEKVANAPSFNLVKLFIKQKSSSSDTCMDVSSGCWPSDSTNSSTEHPGNGSNSSLNRLRKKSMNDSGKCSTLSRHEEDAEYQMDSLDVHATNESEDGSGEKKTNDFNREIFDSPTHRRSYKDAQLNIRNQIKNPLLYNVLNNNNTNSSSGGSRSFNSDGSRTSENLTQILKNDAIEKSKIPTTNTTIPIDMITKSIQTSTMLMPQSETKKLPQNHVKMVPPSFLSQLSKLGDQQQAPVYVIYPNYALPDLEFINHQPMKFQKDIIMSPLSYQGQMKMAQTLNVRQQKTVPLKRRPQSLDIDKLQETQYGHVQDWTSLLTLLPGDYRKLLKNVPEVNRIASMEASMSSQKPLFCMSPPIRRNLGMTCDCHQLLQNQTANSSSSGGSSQPPSSGYRGSSTMLTDSEMEVIINGGSGSDVMKNMFVYQYENVPEMTGHEQRPPTGRKGILRRTNTTSNTPTRVSSANGQKQKRYSMLDRPKSPQQQFTPLPAQQTQQEKRRSLQEPNFYQNGLEEYFNNIGGPKNFANRLPNYMKARDNQLDAEKDLNQLMTELELNKALSNKLNYGQQNGTDLDLQDIEARLRAESFLNSIPKSELKHYAEVANILEWHQQEPPIERTKLRHEVSKALSSRKVSFNHPSPQKTMKNLQPPDHDKKFTTPPNSPQMSQMVNNSGVKVMDKKQQQRLEKEKQDKIQSNRFKRLQIQWELLSKDQEERALLETQSGGNTPTGLSKIQSKIPRPVSYPNSKTTPELQIGKQLRSPSKMMAPKKYTTTPTNQTITSPTTGIPRTPNKHHTTPKKTLPVRSATRTR